MYFNFNKKRLIYILLLVILLCVVAIRSSVHKKVHERFVDNAFTVDVVQKQSPQYQLTSSALDSELTDEEKARRAKMNKWKDCNIFTCKTPDSEADYEAWLKAQKDKLNKYLNDNTNKQRKTVNKPRKCPPRITASEWNEDILTDDEKEVEARLEELQDTEDELNQRIKDLRAQLAEQEREFAMNAATQQQAMNDLENAQRSMKDMKFYENAIDMHVKPWQEAIKKVDKKVTSYEKPIKSIKDLLKKIDELKKKVESIQGVGAAPPKKKKKSLLSKVKKAFKK